MWKKLTLILALTGALALAGCAEGGNAPADVGDPEAPAEQNDGGLEG